MNKRAQYFEAVVDSIADPVFVINRNFEITFMNQAAETVCGKGKISEKKICHLLLHGRDNPCNCYGEKCPAQEVFAGSGNVQYLNLFGGTSLNLENRVFEITASPVISDNGEVEEVVEVFRDVSDATLVKKLQEERQQQQILQEKLAAKNARIHEVFLKVEAAKKEWELTMDCIMDMVIIVNNDDEIRRMNSMVRAFTGKGYSEIIGRNWREILCESGMEFRKMGDIHAGDLELYHPSSERFFLVRSYPFEHEVVEQCGAVITLHDITAMKKVSEDLEESNREIETSRTQLRSALEKISSLISQVAEEKGFDVRFQNPKLKKCWAVMKCEKKDCPCFGKDPVRCWQIAGTYCKGEIQGRFAAKIDNCMDCKFYQDATEDPIYQIGEQFNNMMHILESKTRELEEAYRELKASQATILQQEKMASIGQLAAGVAHEINNPIGFVSSNLGSFDKYLIRLNQFVAAIAEIEAIKKNEEIREEVSGLNRRFKVDFILGDIKDLIEESQEGVRRVREIVQNLKSFSRVDQAESKKSDINECIESTVNIVWNELKYKANLVKVYGEIPLTVCFPQQLNQVFMNLLVNAAQAIENQGEITIRTWHQEDEIFIAISDTGCGISEENIAHLFEPFFTTKEVGKGTGLGLSIAYDIITKNHNGRIGVESETGKGTTFTVVIPVREE